MLTTFRKCITHMLPLLVLSVGLSQAWAGQSQLAWDATTTHTDGTPATDLVGYALSYQPGPAGSPQRVDVLSDASLRQRVAALETVETTRHASQD